MLFAWTALALAAPSSGSAGDPSRSSASRPADSPRKVAAASDADRAELRRLDDDLRKLAAHAQWPGVERTYLAMTDAAERSGLPLTHEQHVIGAQAAEARGDVRATWERLKAAQKVSSREDTLGWIARLEAEHGLVSIRATPLARGALTLEVLDPPDPAQMRTIDAARAELADRRRFDGLLPLGRYRVGNLRFDIDGGPPQQLLVTGTTADAAEEVGILRIDASGTPGARFEDDLQPVLGALDAIAGVARAGVVPPPALLTYVDFTEDQLDALGLTATDLGRAVREQLGVLDTYVAVRPTTLAIRVPSPQLAAVRLALGDGRTVPLDSIATARVAPDDTSMPAGVWLDLEPGADAATVRAAAADVLFRAAPLYFPRSP